jgi:hypothetical protein
VLGTQNTVLPDLASEAVNIVEAGNIDQLTARLESLSRELPGNENIRKAAQRCASDFTWHRFRHDLISHLAADRGAVYMNGRVVF